MQKKSSSSHLFFSSMTLIFFCINLNTPTKHLWFEAGNESWHLHYVWKTFSKRFKLAFQTHWAQLQNLLQSFVIDFNASCKNQATNSDAGRKMNWHCTHRESGKVKLLENWNRVSDISKTVPLSPHWHTAFCSHCSEAQEVFPLQFFFFSLT